MNRWIVLLFCILTCSSLSAWANISITGTLQITPTEYLIQVTETNRTVRLNINSMETLTYFQRLETGDPIVCSGSYTNLTTFSVDNLDFAGIQKLLGVWKNSLSDNFIRFDSFHQVTVDITMISKDPLRYIKRYQPLRYTLSPSPEGWILFMSGRQQTHVGILDFANGLASLKIYDNAIGDLIVDVKLFKLY